MKDDNVQVAGDPLASLGLPAAIRVQASRLMRNIISAENSTDAQRSVDRADGFMLGVAAAQP